MYESIVVAYDGSEFSKAALREAAAWIKRHGGKAVLVHAVYFDEEEFGIAPEMLDKRLEVGKKMCYQAKGSAIEEFGIEAESIICEGEPPEVIADVALGKKAGLIAMGTRGRKGLKRLILGSVTAGVIVNSPCDVLVVKNPCRKCEGGYASVLVPYDGSESGRKALMRACEMSKADGSRITALYVIPRYEEMVGFMRTASIRESMLEEARKILKGAEEAASSEGVSIKAEISDGQAAAMIAEAAKKDKSDLIVMGSYGWKGIDKAIMGSTAERVIMGADCPVLVVR